MPTACRALLALPTSYSAAGATMPCPSIHSAAPQPSSLNTPQATSLKPQAATHVAAGRLRVVQHVLCELHLHASRLSLCTPAAAVLAGLARAARPQLAVILLGCWRKCGALQGTLQCAAGDNKGSIACSTPDMHGLQHQHVDACTVMHRVS